MKRDEMKMCDKSSWWMMSVDGFYRCLDAANNSKRKKIDRKDRIER